MDFQKLFFNQEQIMYQILEEIKDDIIDYLSKNEKKILIIILKVI